MWVVPSVSVLTFHFRLYSLWFSDWFSIFVCLCRLFFAAFKNFNWWWLVFNLWTRTIWWSSLFFFNYFILFIRHNFWIWFSRNDLFDRFVIMHSWWFYEQVYLIEIFILFGLDAFIYMWILSRPDLIHLII